MLACLLAVWRLVEIAMAVAACMVSLLLMMNGCGLILFILMSVIRGGQTMLHRRLGLPLVRSSIATSFGRSLEVPRCLVPVCPIRLANRVTSLLRLSPRVLTTCGAISLLSWAVIVMLRLMLVDVMNLLPYALPTLGIVRVVRIAVCRNSIVGSIWLWGPWFVPNLCN